LLFFFVCFVVFVSFVSRPPLELSRKRNPVARKPKH